MVSKQTLVILFEAVELSSFPEDFSNKFHTHLYCHRGKVNFTFNDQEMECKSGEFVFWFAESRLSNLSFTKNFKASILLVEKEFLMGNVPDQSRSIDAILHSRVYPVKEVSNTKDKQRILNNFRLLHKKYLEFDHRFYSETLRLQMQIFILEMWHTFANEYERRKHTLQKANFVERYMHLLQEHSMTEREVQFYSQQLNITSKYLNFICKTNTNYTASEWIQRYSKERVVLLLQNKNLNIAEIAYQMDFSSTSFFTRYVKKLFGMTPSQYRNRLK